MENSQGKKRPSFNLSLFTTLSESFCLDINNKCSSKSPRNFVQGGVVGLGIVAAMTDLTHKTKADESAAVTTAAPPIPIPIVSSAKAAAANFRGGGVSEAEEVEEEVDELSESYTCVISHLDGTNNLVKKRVYFDHDDDCVDDEINGVGVFSASSPVHVVADAYREFWTADFLSSCCLCKKHLHGLDIFMYRGEKAFCSAECRDKQIRSDDYKEKCASGALKPLDYSVSPCSGPGPLVFLAEVAAA